MSTFITRLDETGTGVRLAVKDLIDVAGVPTTAGCRALADGAGPATGDAPLLAGARAAGARFVGKANLHELAFGATGINPWYGTPVNPLDPVRVPGGSSSGSAVAVGAGEADVAYGSDTGGSVRIPSACCGTAGLKTTFGRIPLHGVWPLAPSLDTVGPMARDVAGVALGMALLEPGFTVADEPPTAVGRVRLPDTDPAIDDALDRALAAAGFAVVEVALPGWADATVAGLFLLAYEGWVVGGHLVDRVGDEVAYNLRVGADVTDDQRTWIAATRTAWRAELAAAFDRVEVLALPSLLFDPPLLDAPAADYTAATTAVNLAGNPALSLPVPRPGRLPASLQLVGPHDSEALLLAAGRAVEQAQ